MAWQTSPIYVVWDVDGTIRAASPSYAALVNLPVEDVVGRVWPDLVIGEEAIGWQQLRLSVETLRAAPVLVVDMPTSATGDTRWLRWTEWAVRDAGGALVQVHSTAIDVTELHEARDALSSVFETVVAARAQGRREVVEQLHNGAVQQLVAARWALEIGDADAARNLVDDALSAVRSSMNTLDPPTPPVTTPAALPFWQQVPTAARDAPLPEPVRLAVADSMVDAVAVISANGAVWLAPTAREALFDDVTDVDVASLLAAAHRDDRDRVVTALLAVLDGEERRVTWRYRHPARGWRRLASLLSPLPFVVNEPKLAVVLSLDITDDIVLDGVDRMDVQLAERERIARDLHDDALQQLAGLRWILIGRDTDADVLEELDAVDASIRGQLAQLHSAVARFGLERALLQLFDHVATPVTWEWPNGVLDTLPLDAAEVLFRSAREALRNVDQHARASAAELVIDVRPRRVVLTVHDDGVGVEPRGVVAAGRAGHLGVSSMREAALAAGGRFELAGRNAGGTRLRLELPLP